MNIEQLVDNKRFEMLGIIEQPILLKRFSKFIQTRSSLPCHGSHFHCKT